MVKKLLACLLVLTLAFTSVNFNEAQAAKIRLNKTDTFVRIGSPIKLKVKNTKKKIKWKSSKKKIATVSKKGVVKGKKVGICYITAKVGKKKFKCRCVVTHKVAKKITKATMKKVSKATKKKGTYDSNEKCYIYRKRFVNGNNVEMGYLKYYPAGNYFSINVNNEALKSAVEFHVGDKKLCKFDAESYEHSVYIKGTIDKTKVSEQADCVNVTDSNLLESYLYTAKQYIYENVSYQAYMMEQILIELKTNVYCEDLGFKWPLSEF